jgi:hypothetical protein
MLARQILVCLDILQAHEDVANYIKEFNGEHGFMFSRETDPVKRALNEKMEELLDDGSHSGASWGCLLRNIQAFFAGLISKDELQVMAAAEQAREDALTAEHEALIADEQPPPYAPPYAEKEILVNN